jgi:transcriptional antiterminator RfaH
MRCRTVLWTMETLHHDAAGLNEAGSADHADRNHELTPKSVPRWYLVQCRSRQDDRALEHLERQGFECYRPLYERERMRRGRKVLASAAIFPGYFFIRLDRVHDNWLPICSTRGVIQVVRFSNYPLPVADAIIEQIRRRIESVPVREPCLKTGERMVITEGSFSGIEAIFVASDGDERVMLLLSILQSEQTLSFPIVSVRKLERKACLG